MKHTDPSADPLRSPRGTAALPNRWAGVLLHPTSLPGRGPVGTLRHARAWLDRLAALGFTAWQVLPLCPPDPAGSPYASWASSLGSPALIDAQGLVDAGLLEPDEARPDDPEATRLRAAQRLCETRDHPLREPFESWCEAQPWLQDTVRYAARKDAASGRPWWAWPTALQSRDPGVLAKTDEALAAALDRWRALAWLFDHQWAEVRRHAEQRGVHLVGDLPIYLAHDSAEVWSRPDLFRLDGQGRPEVVAGCPPDAFTPLGQHWGNPMYRWEAHAREGFAWWVQRIQRTLDQVHTVRIDHFRGFSAGWAIPADAPDARSGSWSEAPGRALFAALRDALGALPFVAEDLGHLDASVHALRARTGIPGMRVLQFGFDGSPDNPHHPDRVPADVVVYPGTHDNNTVRGWFEGLGPDAQRRVCTALGCRPEDAHRALVVSALEGPAVGAVIAVQDLLGLGAQARMNTPGTAQDNWGWRMTSAQQAQLSEADWRPVLTAAGRVRR